MTAAQETSYESQIVRYFLNLVSTKGELSCALKSCIAACPSCPPEVLAKLAAEEDLEIRWELSRNPSCPPETLKQMAEDALCAWSHGAEEMEGNSWQTLTLCAGNPACPPDLLAELVEFAENGWGEASEACEAVAKTPRARRIYSHGSRRAESGLRAGRFPKTPRARRRR